MTKKSALVTGGAGFVGRHMVHELQERGYDVISVDLQPFGTENVMLRASDPTVGTHTHIIQDLRHFLAQMGTNTFIKFELIVHCAYNVGGRASIDGRNMNFIDNVNLDSTLFSWAVRTRQPRVLYFSSSAVYPVEYQTKEHHESLAEDEQVPMDDRAPNADTWYGWAKYVGECMAKRARDNGLGVTVVRPFSGYGEDQSLDYPFPSFIKRVLHGDDPFTVWGDPTQRRDWIHIDDVVNASLAVVESGVDLPVNLCTGVGTSMLQLVDLMWAEYYGRGETTEVIADESRPMGVHTRVGDPTRMLEFYRPQISLVEGVRRSLGLIP